jgi:glyoxylase-like metal-dependent hydrolase (beta-lactamase superfamily II)
VIRLVYEGELGMERKASSVTLIETSRHNVLVDTSSRDVADLIIAKLAEIGVDAKDIDVIINTHLHSGHTGNNSLFKNARIYASPNECVERCRGYLIYPDRYAGFAFNSIDEFDDDEIQIINTPGHTWGSISVVYGDYIIAGDAVPLRKNVLEGEIPKSVDDIAARSSLKRIRMLKKNVVTGHEGIVYAHEFLDDGDGIW